MWPFRGFRRLERFRRLGAGKQKKPWMWPFRGFRGLERFRRLRAGKRQAWTPIKSHGCGLGMPGGCECLANGTLDRPEKAMDLALG